MKLRLQARAIAPAAVLVKELQRESVLLNLDDEHYYGLDEVGSRMWVVLTSRPTIERALEELLREFDVAPGVLRADLGRFVKRLRERGLIEVQDGQDRQGF